jgi:hydroxymethylbilane synthase
MKIKIATRTSQLALVQTHLVIQTIKEKHPQVDFEIVEVITSGDRIQDKSLVDLGGKGLFIKALEEKLLSKEADIAMHSLKDMPPQLDDAFYIAAVLKRHSPNDAFISERYDSIEDLPIGATVGTSSIRRQAALLHLRPDLSVQMIRGNVDTRLRKLKEGLYDAVILAEAGLVRLGLEKHIKQVLSTDLFPPSVGQGIIAIECLRNRSDLIDLLQPINDQETYHRMIAERAMNRALNASCSSAVGSFATITKDVLQLTGVVWQHDGSQKITTIQSGNPLDAEKIGLLAAEELKQKGAEKWLL